ncbi:hypothetical protein ACFOZY_12650 [Chungangia koreensis]|uniref:Uncharacterized protein n=1 Tax=Chungangia koreensis TaxID=752657 RepID=A0ABV8X5R7_9LACT
MKKLLLLFSCFFLLAGCTNNNQETDDPAKDQNDNSAQGDNSNDTGDGESGSIVDADEEDATDNLMFLSYFMKDGTVAHFEGEGNEYATYSARTKYLDDNYISIYEDNGGTVMLRIFRVEEDQVLLVFEQGERYEELKPNELALESLEPISVYLKAPLEKGSEFDGWTVIDTSSSLNTPVKDFENVLVIEKKGEDGTNRRYFAKGYGEIKREFIMTSNGTESKVTSTLSKID